MRHNPPNAHFSPLIGDFVVTVSLNRGVVKEISPTGVLTIEHRDRFVGRDGVYYAATNAVIKLVRAGMEFAVARRRSGSSQLLPMSTSFGNEEYMSYLINRPTETNHDH